MKKEVIPVKTFDRVSQMAHACGGALYVIGLMRLGTRFLGPPRPYALQILVFVGVLLAAIKEFWYDQKYETKIVRGSNERDFMFYCLGFLIGYIAMTI